MALGLSQKDIISRFGNALCNRIAYRDSKKTDRKKIRLEGVNWKRGVVALTVFFDKPKFYMDNGDALQRPSVRIKVKHD